MIKLFIPELGDLNHKIKSKMFFKNQYQELNPTEIFPSATTIALQGLPDLEAVHCTFSVTEM